MIGIDEVGRGSWAGPLLVCAARLSVAIDGLTDSKLLSPKRREALYGEIIHCADIGFGWISADEIDDIGLSQALKQAAGLALCELGPKAKEEVIVDGSVQLLPDYLDAKAIIKADLTIAAVSAASIAAKVVRDKWMAEQAANYPQYNFAKNVGYGTAVHRKAIEEYGFSPLHRRSFALPAFNGVK